MKQVKAHVVIEGEARAVAGWLQGLLTVASLDPNITRVEIGGDSNPIEDDHTHDITRMLDEGCPNEPVWI